MDSPSLRYASFPALMMVLKARYYRQEMRNFIQGILARRWETNPPAWLENEIPDWPGNYKVKYRNTDWQAVIYGNDTSYLKKIIDAGFDSVYLDIIDAYEYFE